MNQHIRSLLWHRCARTQAFDLGHAQATLLHPACRYTSASLGVSLNKNERRDARSSQPVVGKKISSPISRGLKCHSERKAELSVEAIASRLEAIAIGKRSSH